MKKIILLLTTLFFLSGCKKWREGVYEICIYNFNKPYEYLCVLEEDYKGEEPPVNSLSKKVLNSYGNIEYEVKYWSDRSPRDLGYKTNYNGDYEGFGLAFHNNDGFKTPGENGYFAKASSSSSGTSSTSSSSAPCIEGKWGYMTCSSSKEQIWYFDSNGSGYFTNPDCNNICEDLKFNFNYTISGNTCNVDYTSADAVYCDGYGTNTPQTPSDDSFEFSCSGNSLTVTSGSGSNVFYRK
jgi:hypothetical protein